MTNGIINTDLTDDNIIRFMTHLAYKLFDFVIAYKLCDYKTC